MLNIKKLIAHIIGEFERVDVTPSITATTGTLRGSWAEKAGSVKTLRMQVSNSSASSSGTNLFAGTISGDLVPSRGASSASYAGGVAAIAQISAAGNIVVRVVGGTIAANTSVYLSFTYM